MTSYYSTLTALTLVLSLAASGASAFDANLSGTEASRLMGEPLIGDLSVGVRATISRYSGCVKEGRLHLPSSQSLETDPISLASYYEITKQPDGEFTLTYGPSESGRKTLPPVPTSDGSDCSNWSKTNPDTTFYPIKSINGFDDMRSFIVDLINQGYE